MMQADLPRIVLASASTARRAVLEAAGLRFEALPAAVDEAEIKAAAQAEGIPPADAALMLADAKAGKRDARGRIVVRGGHIGAVEFDCQHLDAGHVDRTGRQFVTGAGGQLALQPADFLLQRADMVLQALANRLLTINGVKTGQLVISTTGADLP